ncbi:MAG: arsenate reductase ArsC [Phycisphaerae bacterium]|nr:arsenate reductase ArsC [Phycisphaerae bacterium]
MKKILGNPLKILFLCTGNSCRSQMAEGFARHLIGNTVSAYSAGIDAKGLDPYAVQVMKESGIDISNQHSKTVGEFTGVEFDYCITLCGHAEESCPVFPAKTKIIHRGFDDPPKLAANAKNKQEKITHYRRIRDEIRKYIETLPASLKQKI